MLVRDGWDREEGCLHRQRRAIEAALEDRIDLAVGAGPHCLRSCTGGLEPRFAVPVAETKEAQAGPIALLRMRPIF